MLSGELLDGESHVKQFLVNSLQRCCMCDSMSLCFESMSGKHHVAICDLRSNWYGHVWTLRVFFWLLAWPLGNRILAPLHNLFFRVLVLPG